MNYQIITDEQALREFIDWLPELQYDEKYYLCLFARNKYCKELTHIKSDKAQLKRFVSDKERMFDKIKQLEVELEAYKQKQTPVPQEALALYILPNPRNMMKATINTMVKLAQSIRDQNVMMNPHQEALSEIQKSKSRTVWVDFDLDYKPPSEGETCIDKMRPLQYLNNLRTQISNIVGVEAEVKYLETRGGYHILVNPQSVAEDKTKSWYQSMTKILPEIDQVGDMMIPVPGTYQGGFTPKFV